MKMNADTSGRSVIKAVRNSSAIAALIALLSSCHLPPPQDDASDHAPSATVPAVVAPAPPAPVVAPTSAPAPPPPPPIVSLEDAVSNAAHDVFKNAPASDGSPLTVVIDPLIDGITGYQ